MQSKKKRLDDIDIAKGLAIFLVVFGHIVARNPPSENLWYVITKQAIYSFHMAFFMFLSGIVFFMNLQKIKTWDYLYFQIRKRFLRLMPAYFIFAGIVFLAKYGAQQFVYVDNPVKGWIDITGIALYPMLSISSFLWYVYVLFLFSVSGLVLLALFRNSIIPIFLLGCILIFVPQTPLLGLDQYCSYLLFFSLGGFAIRNWEIYCRIVEKLWVPAFIIFLMMLLNDGYKGYGWIPTSLLSIVGLHGLCRLNLPFYKILIYLGYMSFPIYLMNTLSIGFVKAAMFQFSSWNGYNFLLYAPILLCAGLFIPIFIKKYIIKHIKWLDRVTS